MQKISWKSLQAKFPKYAAQYADEFKQLFSKYSKEELSIEDIDNFINTETSTTAYKIGSYIRYFQDNTGQIIGRVEVEDDNGDSRAFDASGTLQGYVLNGFTYNAQGELLAQSDIISSLLVKENRVQANKNSFRNLLNWFQASYESKVFKSKTIGDFEVQLNEVYYAEDKPAYAHAEIAIYPVEFSQGKREPIKVKNFEDTVEAEEMYAKINTEEDFNLLNTKQAATEQVLYVDYAGGKFESWFYSEGDKNRYISSHDIDEIISKAKGDDFNKFVLTEEAKMFRRSNKKAGSPLEIVVKDETGKELQRMDSVQFMKAMEAPRNMNVADGIKKYNETHSEKAELVVRRSTKKADVPTQSTLFDVNTVDEVINKLQSELQIPFVQAYKSTLGGAARVTIMIKASLDAKDTWAGGYFENSRRLNFSVERDGTVEQFSKSFKIPTKFRKTKVKSIDDLITKLNTYFASVQNTTAIKNKKFEGMSMAKAIEKQASEITKVLIIAPEEDTKMLYTELFTKIKNSGVSAQVEAEYPIEEGYVIEFKELPEAIKDWVKGKNTMKIIACKKQANGTPAIGDKIIVLSGKFKDQVGKLQDIDNIENYRNIATVALDNHGIHYLDYNDVRKMAGKQADEKNTSKHVWIEADEFLRMLEAGLLKVSEIGNENIYGLSAKGKKYFAKYDESPALQTYVKSKSSNKQADEKIDPRMHIPESYSPLYEERTVRPEEWTSYSMEDISEDEEEQPSKYIPKKKQRGKYNLYEKVMTPEGRGRIVMKQVDYEPFSYTIALSGKDEITIVEEPQIQRLASIGKQAASDYIENIAQDFVNQDYENVRDFLGTDKKLFNEVLAVLTLWNEDEADNFERLMRISDKESSNKQAKKHEALFRATVYLDVWVDGDMIEYDDELIKIKNSSESEEEKIERAKDRITEIVSDAIYKVQIPDTDSEVYISDAQIDSIDVDPKHDNIDYVSLVTEDENMEKESVRNWYGEDIYSDSSGKGNLNISDITEEDLAKLRKHREEKSKKWEKEKEEFWESGGYASIDIKYAQAKSAKSVGWLRDKFLKKLDKISDVASEVNDEFKKEREDGEGRGISLIDYYTTGRYHEIEKPLLADAITKSQAEKLMEDLVYQFKTELFAIYNISSSKADEIIDEPKGVSMKEIEEEEESAEKESAIENTSEHFSEEDKQRIRLQAELWQLDKNMYSTLSEEELDDIAILQNAIDSIKNNEKESAIEKEIPYYTIENLSGGYPSSQHLKDISEENREPEGKILSY